MPYKIIKQLQIANPFIYVIKNEHYYLGCTICRKCTKSEIEQYMQLTAEFKQLQQLNYPVECRDCIEFNQYFDNVAQISVDAFSHNISTKITAEIWELIKYLSAPEQENWIQQFKDFQKMLCYRNGKFR